MKIGRISSFHLRYTDTNDFSNQRQTVLVRVETTDGIVGWGEGIAMWPEACKAVRTIIDEGLAPLLLDAGEMPRNRGRRDAATRRDGRPFPHDAAHESPLARRRRRA